MLSALAAMIQLETPHINILSKCDLLGLGKSDEEKAQGRRDADEHEDDEEDEEDPPELQRFLQPDASDLLDGLTAATNPRFERLNQALSTLVSVSHAGRFYLSHCLCTVKRLQLDQLRPTEHQE